MSTTVTRLRGDAIRVMDEEEGLSVIIETNGMLEVYVGRDGRYVQVGWGRAYRYPDMIEWHTKPPFDVVDLIVRGVYHTKTGQEWLNKVFLEWWHKAMWG